MADLQVKEIIRTMRAYTDSQGNSEARSTPSVVYYDSSTNDEEESSDRKTSSINNPNSSSILLQLNVAEFR